jgi:hypothetical protein
VPLRIVLTVNLMRTMSAKPRVLAIAAATGRIGYVFFVGGELRDWKLSKKAAKNSELARAYADSWIETLHPHVVVTEDIQKHSSKGHKTRDLITAISDTAAEKDLLDVKVPRSSAFANKYEEAEALGEQFPEIAAWVPKKPPIWETEPHNTVYFEALALALQVMESS